MNPDERTITLHIAKLNVVLAALNLVQSIASEIVAQAAEQERVANGLDMQQSTAAEGGKSR